MLIFFVYGVVAVDTRNGALDSRPCRFFFVSGVGKFDVTSTLSMSLPTPSLHNLQALVEFMISRRTAMTMRKMVILFSVMDVEYCAKQHQVDQVQEGLVMKAATSQEGTNDNIVANKK